jgi:hypothetical protein
MGDSIYLRRVVSGVGALFLPVGAILHLAKSGADFFDVLHLPKDIGEGIVTLAQDAPAGTVVFLCVVGAICLAYLGWDIFDRQRQKSLTATAGNAPVADPVQINAAIPQLATGGAEAWIPIFKAIEHISQTIGDTDVSGCFPTTLRAIRQAASNDEIAIRGRKEINSSSKNYQNVSSYSELFTSIMSTYWATSVLSAHATSPKYQNDYHTQPEATFSWGNLGWDEKNHYAQLQVNLSDLLKKWPPIVGRSRIP